MTHDSELLATGRTAGFLPHRDKNSSLAWHFFRYERAAQDANEQLSAAAIKLGVTSGQWVADAIPIRFQSVVPLPLSQCICQAALMKKVLKKFNAAVHLFARNVQKRIFAAKESP